MIGIRASSRRVVNAGALAFYLRPLTTIQVYYENDTYIYQVYILTDHEIITLCRCTPERLGFVPEMPW